MLYILTAMVFYTIAILLGTTASRKADSNLVSGVINIISAILPTFVAMSYLSKESIEKSKTGLYFAVLAGVAIAIFSMALNKSFSTDKVAIVSPIVFGGSILLTAILSSLFFKEKITTVQGFGLSFLGLGIVMIIYAKMTGR